MLPLVLLSFFVPKIAKDNEMLLKRNNCNTIVTLIDLVVSVHKYL